MFSKSACTCYNKSGRRVDSMKEIIISNGMIMQVDDKWYEELSKWKWSYSTAGYAYRKKYIETINGKKKYETIFAHRFVLGLSRGDGIIVDHEDENKLNIQEYNLRKATPTQNNANRKSPNVIKQSQYKGVCGVKGCDTWRASIMCNGKQHNLGTFNMEIEAASAYNIKARELFGEFANLNDIVECVPVKRSDTFKNYRGVKESRNRENPSTFAVYIQKDGNRKRVDGIFNTAKEAALAYNNEAIKLFGNKAKLNEVTIND